VSRALVLQHIRCEPPGIFTGVLRRHGIRIETAELDEGDGLPDWRDVDLVVVMGSPMAFAGGRDSMAESAERMCTSWLRQADLAISTVVKPG
jgi:hypothetical protein